MIIIRVIMQCISPALWLTLITSAEEIKLPVPYIGDLMKLRWRQQWERQKNNRFNEENNNFALASCFLVHFFATPAQLRHEMAKFKWRSLENGNGEAINSNICLNEMAKFKWRSLENGNGEAINSNICLNSGGSTLFSSNINSFLFSILATWYNREEVEGCEIYFSTMFSWMQSLCNDL